MYAEEESSEEEKQEEPVPPHKIRASDMPFALQEKVVRSKFIPTFKPPFEWLREVGHWRSVIGETNNV